MARRGLENRFMSYLDVALMACATAGAVYVSSGCSPSDREINSFLQTSEHRVIRGVCRATADVLETEFGPSDGDRWRTTNHSAGRKDLIAAFG